MKGQQTLKALTVTSNISRFLKFKFASEMCSTFKGEILLL